jgi:hypothetical protein
LNGNLISKESAMETTTVERRRPVDHPRNRLLVGTTLIVYGLLLVLADFADVRAEAGMSTSPLWSFAHLGAVGLLALGVWRAQHWAWWGSLVLACVALFLLAPVLIALIGGPGLSTLVPTVHLVLVGLEGAALVFLIALLTWLHREGGR